MCLKAARTHLVQYEHTYADGKGEHLVTRVHTLETISSVSSLLSRLLADVSRALLSFSPAAAAARKRLRQSRKGAGVISPGGRCRPQPSSISPEHLLRLQMRSGRWGSGGHRKGAAQGCSKREERQDEGAQERWERGGLRAEDISPGLKPDSRHSLSGFDFLLCCSTDSAHCNGCWV